MEYWNTEFQEGLTTFHVSLTHYSIIPVTYTIFNSISKVQLSFRNLRTGGLTKNRLRKSTSEIKTRKN